jgi:hypothetical protein
MIDHLMTFPDEATAKADPVVGTYFVNGGWRGDICIPNLFVWSPAANTSGGTDSFGNPIVVRHAYDTNWRLMISKTAQDPVLSALPTCHLVCNRDLSTQGMAVFVLQSVLTQLQLSALAIEPTFMGSNYPFS